MAEAPYGISLDTRFTHHADFVHKEIDGEVVCLNLKNGEYFTLNPVGSHIWRAAMEGRDLSSIVRSVTEEFATTEEQARADTQKFLDEILSQGLLIPIK